MNEDLLSAVHAFLVDAGLSSTASALEREINVKIDPKYSGLLLKKYNAITKLQKQITELKSQLQEVSYNSGFVTEDQVLKMPTDTRIVLSGASRGVTHVAFHDLLPVVAVCSEDCKIRVYDYSQDEQPQFVLTGHAQPINQLLFHMNHLISCSADSTIKVWEPENQREILSLIGHMDSVTCIALVNAETLVSGSKDDSIRFWDLNAGELKRSLQAERIKYIAVSMDGTRMATADHSNVCTLWNLEDCSVVGELHGHEHIIECAEFASPDTVVSVNELTKSKSSEYVFTCSRDRTLKVFCPTTFRCVYTFAGHGSWIRGFCFYPDGSNVVTIEDNGQMRVFDLKNGGQIGSMKTHSEFTTCIAIHKRRAEIGTGSEDKSVKIWSTQ